MRCASRRSLRRWRHPTLTRARRRKSIVWICGQHIRSYRSAHYVFVVIRRLSFPLIFEASLIESDLKFDEIFCARSYRLNECRRKCFCYNVVFYSKFKRCFMALWCVAVAYFMRVLIAPLSLVFTTCRVLSINSSCSDAVSLISFHQSPPLVWTLLRF